MADNFSNRRTITWRELDILNRQNYKGYGDKYWDWSDEKRQLIEEFKNDGYSIIKGYDEDEFSYVRMGNKSLLFDVPCDNDNQNDIQNIIDGNVDIYLYEYACVLIIAIGFNEKLSASYYFDYRKCGIDKKAKCYLNNKIQIRVRNRFNGDIVYQRTVDYSLFDYLSSFINSNNSRYYSSVKNDDDIKVYVESLELDKLTESDIMSLACIVEHIHTNNILLRDNDFVKLDWVEDRRSKGIAESDKLSSFVDMWGVRYSNDGKKLLKCENPVLKEYCVRPGTKVICSCAFHCHETIEKIELPESVEFIGDCAFEGCRNLYTFAIPVKSSLKSIGSWGFKCCWHLYSIFIPDGVIEVGYHCFKAAGLEYVRLPKSVKLISHSEFIYCGRLEVIEVGKNNINYWKSLLEDTDVQSKIKEDSWREFLFELPTTEPNSSSTDL